MTSSKLPKEPRRLKLDEAKQDSNKMTKENPRQLPKYPKMLKLDQAKQDPVRMTNEEPHQLPEESNPRFSRWTRPNRTTLDPPAAGRAQGA